MNKKNKKTILSGMPALTIDGKRAIINQTLDAVGEKAFVSWLKKQKIPSIRYINENVRKYKAGFFREMFELSQN
ncbi:MAG: hypothetical protein GY730_03655 [bacterium]|nr:hypothetical protein [bacterium]